MSDVDENESGGSVSVLLCPIVFTILVHIFLIAPNVVPLHKAGFFTWVLYYLTGIIGGIILSAIANQLRQSLMPDAVYTTDGFWGLLKAKVFWAIGPQVVASIIIPMVWSIFRFPTIQMY